MKAICIDDEQLALDYLERQINKLKNIEVIGKHLHPLEGMKHIINEEVDIVFLDIQLPEMNGIELAEQIIKEKPEIIVVFVTAFDKYAVEAFELNAIDYLVKPIKFDRLQMTMDRIVKKLNIKDEVNNRADVLKVKVSNYLAFEVEPNTFKPIPWRTAKTQELFLYLLQNRGTLVEKSTLMELLWDVYEPEKGYSLLYTTVYNVRKALKQFSDYFILHNTTDGYLLELKNVKIDLFDWEMDITKLPTLNKSTVKQYEEIMEQNKAAYLQTHDYIWIEAERHRLEKLWHTIANKIATYFEECNKLNDAIKWYKNICDRYPENEESYFSLMKIYAQNGEYELVAKQYRHLIKVFSEELSIEPSSYIRKWYEKQIINKINNKNIDYPL